MMNPDDPGAVLYGDPAAAKATAEPALEVMAEPAAPAAAPRAEQTDATPAEDDAETTLYGEDGGEGDPPPEGNYDPALAGVFDQLEHQARFERNEEDQQSLAEGRRETAELFREMQVPLSSAQYLTSELGAWATREPLAPEHIDAGSEAVEVELRKEWGENYDKNIVAARKVYREACERLPWLEALVEAGAGNDKKLIMQFFNVARRQERLNRVHKGRYIQATMMRSKP